MIETIVELISRKPSKPERPFMGELPSAVQELKLARIGLLSHAEQGIEIATASIAEVPQVKTFEAIPVYKENAPAIADVDSKVFDTANTIEKANKPETAQFQMTKETADQAELAAAARKAMEEHYSDGAATKSVVPQG